MSACWLFLQYLLSVALHRSVPRLRSVTNTQSHAQANAQGSRMLGRQKQDSNACTGRPKRSHADSRRQEGENTVTAFQGVWARSPCTSSSAQPCECRKGRRRRSLARCVICLSLYGNRTTGRQKETNRERYSFRCHNFPFILNIAAYCHPRQFKPHWFPRSDKWSNIPE